MLPTEIIQEAAPGTVDVAVEITEVEPVNNDNAQILATTVVKLDTGVVAETAATTAVVSDVLTKKSARKVSSGPRKPRRFRPGTRSLMEIRKLQKSTDSIIPRAAFVRVVREIAQKYQNFRFTVSSLSALQEVAEEHLIETFQRSQLIALNAKRISVTVPDMKLSQQLLAK